MNSKLGINAFGRGILKDKFLGLNTTSLVREIEFKS